MNCGTTAEAKAIEVCSANRKLTNITLAAQVLEDARRLGINVSPAAESGVRAAIRAESAGLWKTQNAGAIADYNACVEVNGVPLVARRKF